MRELMSREKFEEESGYGLMAMGLQRLGGIFGKALGNDKTPETAEVTAFLFRATALIMEASITLLMEEDEELTEQHLQDCMSLISENLKEMLHRLREGCMLASLDMFENKH